jgi:Ser/Thr protein kinase RdoA (MazF antagonist)
MISALIHNWNVGAVREAHEIHPGRVWRVAGVDGRAYILKDIGAGPDVERRFAFERDVLRHLDRAGVGVALPIPDRRGQALVEHGGRLYTLSPYLATEDRWQELDLEGLARLNHNCGAAIARLHAALATFSTHGLAQRTWRTHLPDEWFVRSIPAIQRGLASREQAAFDRLIQAVEGEMRTAASGLPEQLIHRDCHHGNIVVHGEQVSGFVDCDHLSLGPRVLDLADFLVHAVKGHVADRQATERWFVLAPALLEGYQGENPLSDPERRALYATMLGILLMFAAWFYETGPPQHAPRELETLAWMVEQRARIRRALES